MSAILIPSRLFHISHLRLSVVRPSKSEGSRPFSWYVGFADITHAIAYVRKKRGVSKVFVHAVRTASLSVRALRHGTCHTYFATPSEGVVVSRWVVL